jgi:uroporphyrinogen decarboxylase
VTSRERVLAAIAHKEPDRTPIDLGATPSSGISAIAYSRLAAHLGVPDSQVRVYDVVQELAQPEDWALDRFGVDVLDIGRTFNTEATDWNPITLRASATEGYPAHYPAWFHPSVEKNGTMVYTVADGTPIAAKPVGATFFDQTHFPFLDDYPADIPAALPDAMGKVLWAAMVHSPWDHAGDQGFWETLRTRTLKLRETTDKALMVVVGCNLFEWGTFLRRMDNFLMDVYADQDNVERLLDGLMAVHLANLEKVCEAVGDIVDLVRFGDDLGIDSGPFMAPDIYRKLFKPRHRQLCDYVKSHSSMHTFLHSCGSIYQLIPDLVDAGFEVLNPVQTNTKDMEPERLKAEFGDDVTFWGGGADTRHVLNSASPEQVREHVAERLRVFGAGGGFVFNTVHNIMPDVPPENIVAMFDTVLGHTREGEGHE